MSADLLLSRDKDQTLAQLSMNPAVFPVVFLQRYERQKMVDNMNHMIHIVNHIEIRQINNHCTQTAGRPTRTEFRYVTLIARQRHRFSHSQPDQPCQS
jgi:hypothetical protein